MKESNPQIRNKITPVTTFFNFKLTFFSYVSSSPTIVIISFSSSKSCHHRPPTNTSEQILLYFDRYYSAIYFILGYLSFIYKGYTLYYPPGALAVEVIIFTMFLIWQYIRIDLGEVGNKTETSKTTILFNLLGIFEIISFVFFITLQTYVMMVEVVINSVGLGFISLEILTGFMAAIAFKNYEKTQ